MMKKDWISFLIILLLASCNTKNGKNSSNSHMNSRTFAELVQQYEDRNRAIWQKPNLIIQKMDIKPDQTIADIGAGTGYFSFILAQKSEKIIAIDIDERFLDYIDKKKDSLEIYNIQVMLSKDYDPLLLEEEAHQVLTVNTYHHIENRVDYFNKVKKGLKPGGYLWVVDFKKGDLPVGPPNELKYSAEIVAKELTKAGFTNLEIDSQLLPYQYIIKAKKDTL